MFAEKLITTSSDLTSSGLLYKHFNSPYLLLHMQPDQERKYPIHLYVQMSKSESKHSLLGVYPPCAAPVVDFIIMFSDGCYTRLYRYTQLEIVWVQNFEVIQSIIFVIANPLQRGICKFRFIVSF